MQKFEIIYLPSKNNIFIPVKSNDNDTLLNNSIINWFHSIID